VEAGSTVLGDITVDNSVIPSSRYSDSQFGQLKVNLAFRSIAFTYLFSHHRLPMSALTMDMSNPGLICLAIPPGVPWSTLPSHIFGRAIVCLEISFDGHLRPEVDDTTLNYEFVMESSMVVYNSKAQMLLHPFEVTPYSIILTLRLEHRKFFCHGYSY
jgi:hypothetical protein